MAVRSLYALPALIVDFGTATTFTLIDADGNYCGGAIAPGVNTALDALCAKAAKLPQISLKHPPGVWARNTIHAIQSGSVFGTIAMVDGMIERLAKEFGDFTSIVLSGGLSSFFKNEIKRMTVCNPSLNLTGLRLIHELINSNS
jgi:type III pantothenate kinase